MGRTAARIGRCCAASSSVYQAVHPSVWFRFQSWGGGEGSRKEGELSGSWELFSCFSVSLNHNHCHMLKDLIAGTENLFGKVPNL